MKLKAAGMVGIEAYYHSYGYGEVGSLVARAENQGLLVTGGSDYHGLDDGNETMMGEVEVPVEVVQRLIARAEPEMLKLAYLK